MEIFTGLVLIAAWSALCWAGGWRACRFWEHHCRVSERMAQLVTRDPHPADDITKEMMAEYWMDHKAHLDEEWTA